MDKLIKQLNTLKEIKPRASWKEENREILFSQISSTETNVEVQKGFFSIVYQPAWAVFCILLIIVGGGIFSAEAAKNTKPGDSMFIARVISEKAQIAMTFNKEKRVKLDMQFAHNHAKEINEILADPAFDYKNNKKKAEKLAYDFKQKLNTVKERLQEIKTMKEERNDPVVGLSGLSKEDKVFGADSGKNDKSMDFYDPTPSFEEEVEKIEDIILVEEEINIGIGVNTTTEDEIGATSTDIIELTFNEAESSFDAKDFEGTRDFLEQVDEIIENMDEIEEESGEVKGTSTATEVDDNISNSTSTKE